MATTDVTDQVRQAIDLVELIGQTVALKRRGRNFIGLCPFHQEKTPSFTVNPARQAFYCFGCKASGTVFDFVMKRDRVEFKDALEILARQAGIELPQYRGQSQKTGERQLILDALSAACRLFENQISAPSGVPARDYLAQRGFTPESLKRFQVGLALDSWDALLRSPIGKKFSPQLLSQAGLLKPREKGDGYYDTFRNRIMFPIRNESGQIIAFGGRVVPGSTDPAKYLNSPETPVFSKSRSIFGIDLARHRIVETRTVAVVEGYTDVVMAHQFGASNVVSVLGTAMTEQHVAILRRFADRIVLLFDADTAGDAAVDRVIGLFLTQPVEIAVASMPQGLDPDEFLLKNGAAPFDQMLAQAPGALEYAWRQMSRRFIAHDGDLTGQQKAAKEFLELLASARNAGPVDNLRWGAVLARVGRLTDIPIEELHRRFKTRRPKAATITRSEGEPTVQPQASVEATGQTRAERHVLGVLLAEPGRWHDVQLALRVDDFIDSTHRALADQFWSHQRHEGEAVFNEFLDTLPSADLKTRAIELVKAVDELVEEVNELNRDLILTNALADIATLRDRGQEQRKIAESRRLAQETKSAEAETTWLTAQFEAARRPDAFRNWRR